MKKTYFVFILLSMFASCSGWKYSNGIKGEKSRYNYSSAKASMDKTDKEELSVSKKDEVLPSVEIIESNLAAPKTAMQKATETILERHESIDLNEMVIVDREEDTVQVANPQAVKIAMGAEHRGKVSRNLAFIGLALTVTYIFALAGLVLMIISLIKGANSLNASYNTPRGVKMARTGVIISSVMIALYVLALILLVFLILTFL